MSTEYIPGICNINPKEVQKRRRIGIIGTVISFALIVVMVAYSIPPFVGGALFVSSFIAATGFLQAANKFCVGYAKSNMQRVGDTDVTIEDSDAQKKDKTKSRKINLQSAGIALVVTVIATIVAITI